MTFEGWQIMSGSGSISSPASLSTNITWTSASGTIRAKYRYTDGSTIVHDWEETGITAVGPSTSYSVSGGGTQCTDKWTVYLSPSGSQSAVSYQLYRNGSPYGSPIIGDGSSNQVCFNCTIVGGENLVTALPDGHYTVVATLGSCPSVQLPNSADITNVALPLPFNAAGGSFCQITSTTGTATLSNSESGVDYYLSYYSTSMVSPFGKQTSAGGGLSWTGLSEGTYYIWARRPTPNLGEVCDTKMNNSAPITSFTTTTPYTVTGIGHYCQGSSGATIKLSNSLPASSGWTYWLYKDNASSSNSKPGAGGVGDGSITWTNITVAGTYSVVAVPPNTSAPSGTISGCVTLMNGTVQVVADPLPAAYAVTGSSSCDGSTSFVQLSNSQGLVHYQLLLNGAVYLSPKSGGSGAITWNQQIVPGTYTIQAVFDDTGCSLMMTGQQVIGVSSSSPTIFNVTTQNTCTGATGGTITLSGSQASVSYQLYKDGVANGTAVAGNGSALNWTTTVRNGVYTVKATGTGGCTAMMNGSPTISNPIVNIQPTKYPCTYYFAPTVTELNDCAITAYSWNFGDGGTSTDSDPFHAYAGNGNFTVTLQVTAACGTSTCNLTVTKPITVSAFTYKDSVVQVHTDRKLQVISTTASTFSDSWGLPYEDVILSGLNEFTSCERGVWRNEGSYVYTAQRDQSTPVNTSVDGTFTLEQFNWQQASLDAVPNWVKATTSTQYSQFSYELEEKDVLNVYSANLYDYGGHLPSANGSNMRNNEMAFTGFESFTCNPPLSQNCNSSGNWVFGTQPTQTFFSYKVFSAFNHMVVVEADLSKFTGVNSIDVVATGVNAAAFRGITQRVIVNDPIVCSVAYTANTSFTTLVLNDAPFSGVWTGKIIVRKQITPVVTATLDNAVSHTGAKSLKITANQTFSQPLLCLDQGKSYMVSAWVSINNPNVTSPQLGTNIGFDVVIKDNAGVVQGTFPFQAVGPVIEGWQQVKGSFTCPIAQSKMEVTFRPGSAGTVWFDDLRLHPNNGNMKSYVYDLRDYRLTAILDEENFASLFYYDDEGNLFLSKKETERGRKTISENITHLKPTN
jgi:hypothetical protein